MVEEKKELSTVSKEHSVTTENKFGSLQTRQQAEMAAIQVAESARAEIEAAFILALKMPRSEAQARQDIVDSCRNLTFAEKAIYKKPVGKKQVAGQWVQNYVEGPSIRFAEEMIRSWKNIKIQRITIYEDDLIRSSRVNVIDLQSNVSYSVQIVVDKTVERKNAFGRDVVAERLNSKNERIFIVRATDDEIRNKEAALASKEIRNNSLRMIPQHIIDDAMVVAKETIEKGVSSDIAGARKTIVDGFARLGVLATDIEKYLDHSIEKITPKEIADLRGIFTTIKDGQAKWSDYVSGKVEEKPKAEDPGRPFKVGDQSTHRDVKTSAKKK